MYTEFSIENLYHISPLYNLSILFPRIPTARQLYENDEIERICFSDNIVNCIYATNQHHLKNKLYIYQIKHILKNVKYKDLSEAKLSKIALGVSNDYLIKNRLVDDAHITNEIWVCEPTILKLIGEIELDRKENIIYTYIFNDEREGELMVTYPNYKIKMY